MKNEYLVKTWLNNELSEAEAKAFKALDDSKLYEDIILEAQRFKGDTQAKVASFEELDLALSAKKKIISINWMKIMSSAAAILIVGIAMFSLLNKNNIDSFKTSLAQNEIITLPDNSIVNLNQLSQLDYNPSKWDEKRTLNLSGEAFFDVEKGKRFDVKTKQGTVSVLGTEFNVLATDSIFKVSCYEGLVKVSFNNKEVEVPVGTEFILKSGNANKSEIVIAEPYWIKKMSVFENTAINDVFKEFELQYKVSITNISNLELKFTGAFEHNNLVNALKSITQPLNLTFEILNSKEVIIRNVNKE